MTQSERDCAIRMLQAGATTIEVANAFSRTDCCICKLYAKFNTTHTTVERPRSGRPPILSRHARKLVYRAVRKSPKITYTGLQKVAQVYLPDGSSLKLPSASTLYRELKRRGLTNYLCRKRPKLTPYRARLRLDFSEKHLHYL